MILCILFTALFSGCAGKNNDDSTTNTTESKTESTTKTTTESITESTTESTTETTKDNTSSTTPGTTKKPNKPASNNTTTPSYTSSSGAQAVAKSYFSDAAFVGDSISVGLRNRALNTKRLPGATFLVRGSFGTRHAVNRTMSLTYQGKEMSTEDAVKASGAKKVFIMFGMNDLNVTGLQGSVNNMEILINRIKAKCPGIKVYIQSMTPIVIGSESGKLNNRDIDEYNRLLKSFAAKNGYTYIDVAKHLKDSNNGLNKKYCSDNYVHLNNSGLDVWISVLEMFAKSQVPPETTTVKETTTTETTTKESTSNTETSEINEAAA